jgi:hypothetical protein
MNGWRSSSSRRLSDYGCFTGLFWNRFTTPHSRAAESTESLTKEILQQKRQQASKTADRVRSWGESQPESARRATPLEQFEDPCALLVHLMTDHEQTNDIVWLGIQTVESHRKLHQTGQ